MSDLKPGDRALVVGTRSNSWGLPLLNGHVVTVETHPEPFRFAGGQIELGSIVAFGPDDRRIVATRCLIPLPPDDEAKRLFRETEKPVAA